ncbi:hypothetical protein LTR09_000274 [Extremus antarcticus]|uniref:Uncharacterized protein n=1 Tax=Extremus antarcticus TaxID=702011 RepID=A0AAJ0LXD9_9PEZI|nr:hypothetical protein LTR09_000274 [Extremus antarcticus]
MTQRTPPRPIRACLFDMDGLLINTEDLITTSINTILHNYNKPSMPGNIRAQLQGLHLKDASKILLEWSQLPLTFEEYQIELAEQHQRLFPTAKPMPGVVKLLETLGGCEQVELALATSSGRGKFELKTSHLSELFSYFPAECQILGDDPRLGRGKGKPEPDIYLLALHAVKSKIKSEGKAPISPGECLVFEDSVAGVRSGRRAGMQVVWCPHPDIIREYHGREEEVLAGDARSGEHADDAGAHVRGNVSHDPNSGSRGPLWSEDGWARLLTTLEGFSYEEFGITP